ncbi:hypothetical protein J6590_037020 [Homalodisca vitripennis]|nr:hypothetical protein J6590_037020 [Homalodisca vitripennis]
MRSADVIQLQIYFDNLTMTLFGVNRFHNFSVLDFLDEIEPYFVSFKSNSIVNGDFNIDIKKTTIESEAYISLFYNNSFSSLITDYTRSTVEHSSCLDQVFVRNKNYQNSNQGFFN